MKNSKRILGVVLALIMIFNVFAVGTFAAFPDDAVVKLALRADKATYAPGETITLTFSEQCIEDVGFMMIGGQYDMGYNSSVFELVSTATDDTNALDKHGFIALQDGYDAGMSSVQIPSSAGFSEIYDWDTAVTWNVADDMETNFPATEMTDLFTVQIKVKDDAPYGTYTIGFNPAGYEGYNAYSNDGIGYGGLYGAWGEDYGFAQENMYEYGTCEITVGTAEEDDIVYHVKDQIQWADKAANTVNLGVVAGFDVEDIDIAFDGNGTSTNVTAVGATVVINGVEETKTERFVYEMNDGASYYFRTVIAGIPADSTDEIVVTPFVTYTVNGESKTEYCDAVTVTAASLAANLPA